jgi:hypothetical protein
MNEAEARGEGESARQEALRLAREAGFEFVDQQDMIPPECFPLTDSKVQYGLEAFMRLVSLARQRPGWVWVPEDDVRGAVRYLSKSAITGGRALSMRIQASLAAAPKPGEGT